MKTFRNASDIIAYFSYLVLDAESRQYLHSQAPRYLFLLASIDKILTGINTTAPGQPVHILDIGPAYQTELMRHVFKNVLIDTLGFEDIRFRPRQGEKHFQFDLNDLQNKVAPAIGQYDMILMAEVLEHLYTSPEVILEHAATWLRPGGNLVLQTPNALSLRKRIRVVLGNNPQDIIRISRTNPGHFREYTAGEVVAAAKEAGLSLVYCYICNFPSNKSRLKNGAYNTVCRFLPASFKDEIFLCLRKIPS